MLTKTDLADISALLKEQVPSIVRQEMAPLQQELASQGMRQQEMRADIYHLKESVRSQGVLYEILVDKFDSLVEVLTDSWSVKDKVENHEIRLGEIESVQKLYGKTLRSHSRRLRNV
jgi:hypothetical protein